MIPIVSKKTSETFPLTTGALSTTVVNGFFTVDNTWVVKTWNDDAASLLGISPGEIVGKNAWHELAHLLPLPFYLEYHKVFNALQLVTLREYFHLNGCWLDIIAFCSRDKLSVSFRKSVQPEMINTNKDLAKTEKRMCTIHEMYRSVTEVLRSCLWEWNFITDELFWIDGGHRNIFGYELENMLIPVTFWECCIHPEDLQRVKASLQLAMSSPDIVFWEDEYRLINKAGVYLDVQDRGKIIRDDAGVPQWMFGSTSEITDRKRREYDQNQFELGRKRELLAAVITAQENERSMIGTELHDNLNQILAVTKLYLQMAATSPVNRDLHLQKCIGFIQEVMTEIRRISRILIIPGVEIIGLEDNISNLIQDIIATHPIKITFESSGMSSETIEPDIQLSLFRIVQEQFNNILKHAHASIATIRLSVTRTRVMMTIIDNGSGADLSKKRSGVGVLNMTTRTELHHGSLALKSSPAQGYIVKVFIPLRTALNDRKTTPVMLPRS